MTWKWRKNCQAYGMRLNLFGYTLYTPYTIILEILENTKSFYKMY